jgi:N-acetylglucosamine-6-sulfatase
MTARARRTLVALIALAACAQPLVAPARATHDLERPNIVLIMSDDQSYESIHKMPFLKSRMKRRRGWWRFENAFINNPTCCPSRATILSGQWSHHTGVESTGGAPRFADGDTLATRLQSAGYRTGFVGKYHLGPAAGKGGEAYVPPGWTEFADHKADSKPYYGYRINENGTITQYGSAPADYSTDVLRDKFLGFLDRSAGAQPFFGIFAPRAPHNNWAAAPRHLGHYANAPVKHSPSYNEADMGDKPGWWHNQPVREEHNVDGARRKEWDTLLALDEAVKAIQQRLRALKVDDNTIIVYMTDNAYAFGEHRNNGKLCLYDVCSHTPMLIKVGNAHRRRRLLNVVGNEDLAATFTDLAHTAPPARTDGQSFASLLRTGRPPEGFNDEMLLRTVQAGNQANPPNAWSIRTRRFKYILTEATGEVELYDLKNDPDEIQSVAGQPRYAAVQAQLAARLDTLRR